MPAILQLLLHLATFGGIAKGVGAGLKNLPWLAEKLAPSASRLPVIGKAVQAIPSAKALGAKALLPEGGLSLGKASFNPTLGGLGKLGAGAGGFVGGAVGADMLLGGLFGESDDERLQAALANQRHPFRDQQNADLAQLEQEAALRQALQEMGIDLDDLLNRGLV